VKCGAKTRKLHVETCKVCVWICVCLLEGNAKRGPVKSLVVRNNGKKVCLLSKIRFSCSSHSHDELHD
jgi:hypothetical protein